ncbi:addiction module protein [Luteolibacter ambystomatis]|uniref:Addiction module protein n=1 Tax=Luteolibacter ambystomatis TaxID=2824561 RepID=A0A975G8T1_9BACT|nr:addiction module protein [Luteolibacter ambystomatis]QUE50861.1 addiction module protein [Luteolibacter ambystomatis]
MSRIEKLQAMHLLWEDLAADESTFDSPAWQRDALASTASEVATGNIRELDWETAKRQLRDRAQ